MMRRNWFHNIPILHESFEVLQITGPKKLVGVDRDSQCLISYLEWLMENLTITAYHYWTSTISTGCCSPQLWHPKKLILEIGSTFFSQKFCCPTLIASRYHCHFDALGPILITCLSNWINARYDCARTEPNKEKNVSTWPIPHQDKLQIRMNVIFQVYKC